MEENQTPVPAPPETAPEAPKAWEAFKILEKTILVENQGEEFEFAIPSSLHEIKIGAAIRRIRREADPYSAGQGEELGWDQITYLHTRAVATILVCLVRTSAEWIYTKNTEGKPWMDWQNWPPENVERLLEISLAFDSAVSRFRAERNRAKQLGAPPRA
jgi:hypothetical protein